MLRKKERLTVSPYTQLYDILVPEDHVLRRINTLVDFSFIYDELKKNYTVDFGRNAADPVYMLKLLLLKILNPLSDRDLCERARYDMSFKYFLEIAPEDNIIHPSLLSKFRRQRLKDTNLLDLLLKKTIDIAKANNVIIMAYKEPDEIETFEKLMKLLSSRMDLESDDYRLLSRVTKRIRRGGAI